MKVDKAKMSQNELKKLSAITKKTIKVGNSRMWKIRCNLFFMCFS